LITILFDKKRVYIDKGDFHVGIAKSKIKDIYGKRPIIKIVGHESNYFIIINYDNGVTINEITPLSFEECIRILRDNVYNNTDSI
jgi:hypothetical protein